MRRRPLALSCPSPTRTHPVVWSVACKNGDFAHTTCFAEARLRATYGGEPAGAAAFLGSTIHQSWDPPRCGQDEMVALLAEATAAAPAKPAYWYFPRI